MRWSTLCLLVGLLFNTAIAKCSAAQPQTGGLTDLMKTNQEGFARLEPAWVGESKEALATGFMSNHPLPHQLERDKSHLHFDLFGHYSGTSETNPGSRVICKSYGGTKSGWKYGNLYYRREVLPTDVQIAKATTLSMLTNLLGTSRGGLDAHGDGRVWHSAASWSLFRFRNDRMLETLSVSCLTTHTNGQSEIYVDGVSVWRGTVHPVENHERLPNQASRGERQAATPIAETP